MSTLDTAARRLSASGYEIIVAVGEIASRTQAF